MSEVPKTKSIAVLGSLLLICVGGGAMIGVLTAGSIDSWYAELNQPVWTPPNWVFGPVWTMLYCLMAISMWLVWKTKVKQGQDVGLYALIFAIQLVLNFLWTPVFFSMHELKMAFGIIVLLWFVIGINIFHFQRVSRLAGGLLVPYLCWVTYATSLNAGFIWLNP